YYHYWKAVSKLPAVPGLKWFAVSAERRQAPPERTEPSRRRWLPGPDLRFGTASNKSNNNQGLASDPSAARCRGRWGSLTCSWRFGFLPDLVRRAAPLPKHVGRWPDSSGYCPDRR